MAITQDYVAYATGNDYKGASFTDGAWTAATHTLAKAGAFAATKVNHWLYLEPNGGASFTAGYYRVATVPDANSVTLASDPAVGNLTDVKCTQHDGTTTLPWRSLQGAFDLLTRNATDGNQVNLKAGTAQVNAAALDLTTFIAGGALSSDAPLIIRGYTTTANDGGIGEIDCGGATMFAATTYDCVVLINLEIHSAGNNNCLTLDANCLVYRCEIHKGASSPVAKALLYFRGASCAAIGNYLHDAGTGAGYYIAGSTLLAVGNYIEMGAMGYRAINWLSSSTITGNIVLGGGSETIYGYAGTTTITNNIVYGSASTGRGIKLREAQPASLIANNIIAGFSGAGGVGIEVLDNAPMIGHNAFYNNTANYVLGDMTFIDLTANDVALAADPFTDAANGDFSLTAAAKAALADKGFPVQYLGAHANTAPHITIGAIQQALATGGGGGGPVLGSRIIRGLGAV